MIFNEVHCASQQDKQQENNSLFLAFWVLSPILLTLFLEIYLKKIKSPLSSAKKICHRMLLHGLTQSLY